MKNRIQVFTCCLILFFSCACAYRHYLGLHGPSVVSSPEIHDGVTEDSACRQCHRKEQASEGPATNHSDFTGCLKCHNDGAE